MIGRSLENVGEMTWEQKGEIVRDDPGGEKFNLRTGLLRNARRHEELPAYILSPADHAERVPRIVWLGDHGKSSVFEADGSTVRPEVREILRGGAAILAPDLFQQGEFLQDGVPLTKTRRVKNPREAAAYTFGYNHALFARRVHDLLSALRYLDQRSDKPVQLVAFERSGAVAGAARVIAIDAIDAAVIEMGDFDFAAIDSVHDVDFLPAAAKYGGLPGLLALGAPGRTYLLHKGSEVPALAGRAYANLQKRDRLEHAPPSKESRIAAIRWLFASGTKPIAELSGAQ
jgi:hypothetical protein